MKVLTYTLLLCLAFISGACGREESPPAEATAPQQPVAQQPAAQPSAVQPAPSPGLEQFAPPTETRQPYPKVPDFFDAPKRQIKDLPSFPRFLIADVRFGPLPGGEMTMISGTAYGKFDEVVDFYDKAIKKNKWVVGLNPRDPSDVAWQLTRGSLDQAAVEVKLDKISNRVVVAINRVRLSAAPQENK
ncbi:MAG TPA: hypothetical protein VFV34_08280 [Blastocatellia bacterium]|nr:hypothetical protein [Blastocatellia bacterium]